MYVVVLGVENGVDTVVVEVLKDAVDVVAMNSFTVVDFPAEEAASEFDFFFFVLTTLNMLIVFFCPAILLPPPNIILSCNGNHSNDSQRFLHCLAVCHPKYVRIVAHFLYVRTTRKRKRNRKPGRPWCQAMVQSACPTWSTVDHQTTQ